MSQLIFRQLFDPTSSTYTYLLGDAESGVAVLIDPVLEMVERDLKLIDELNLKLLYVLDTHVHADHVTGAGLIRERTGAKSAVASRAQVACADVHLKEGDVIRFGTHSLNVLETPGHTDSSLSFYCNGMVFTGDALLIRGCGRTDFQGGSADQLYQSVREKLFALHETTQVFPGHDYKGMTSSTIKEELAHNPRLAAQITADQFRQVMKNLKLDYPKQMDRAVPANQSCGFLSSKIGETMNVPTVRVNDVRQNVKNEMTVIDVRRSDEFNAELGHIDGAHLATLGPDLDAFLKSRSLDDRLMFVCRSGKRSEEATRLALDRGFKNVLNMAGGMLEWNQQNRPVVRS